MNLAPMAGQMSYSELNHHVCSGKLTLRWKTDGLKMYFLLKIVILHCMNDCNFSIFQQIVFLVDRLRSLKSRSWKLVAVVAFQDFLVVPLYFG